MQIAKREREKKRNVNTAKKIQRNINKKKTKSNYSSWYKRDGVLQYVNIISRAEFSFQEFRQPAREIKTTKKKHALRAGFIITPSFLPLSVYLPLSFFPTLPPCLSLARRGDSDNDIDYKYNSTCVEVTIPIHNTNLPIPIGVVAAKTVIKSPCANISNRIRVISSRDLSEWVVVCGCLSCRCNCNYDGSVLPRSYVRCLLSISVRARWTKSIVLPVWEGEYFLSFLFTNI